MTFKKARILSTFIVIMLVVVVAVSGCTKPEYPKITLSNQTNNQVDLTMKQSSLRVAVASMTSAKESIIYYEKLFNSLEEFTGRPVQIVQRETYGEINDLIRGREVDLAFVCSYSYVLGKDERIMELLVAPEINGHPIYQSIIIVPADSPVTEFSQLQGKSFAFTDPLSNSGRLYPLYLIKQLGKELESYFSRTTYTYSHDNSIDAVAEHLVDGAAVESLVYNYILTKRPDYKLKIKVIHESPYFGIPPVVVRPDLDTEFKELLRQFFLTRADTEQGQQILAGLMLDGFVLVNDSEYDSIREMLQVVFPGEE